ALEIYVEPFLAKPRLVLVGHGPVIEALASLGPAVDFEVLVVAAEQVALVLPGVPLDRASSVVVATHGDGDEDALADVLGRGAGYVSLVASRRRAASVVESLRRRGLSSESIAHLKARAGIDMGGVTRGEIALSILAEMVQVRRGDKSAWTTGAAEEASHPSARAARESRDPVCGMMVETAGARHRSEAAGRTVYFCCAACKERFDLAPESYLTDLAE